MCIVRVIWILLGFAVGVGTFILYKNWKEKNKMKEK
jgi:hypothetical protein